MKKSYMKTQLAFVFWFLLGFFVVVFCFLVYFLVFCLLVWFSLGLGNEVLLLRNLPAAFGPFSFLEYSFLGLSFLCLKGKLQRPEISVWTGEYGAEDVSPSFGKLNLT